jgi:hypothetical protein
LSSARQQIAAILDERTPGIEEPEREQIRSRQVRILKSDLRRGRMREGGRKEAGERARSECRRGGKEETSTWRPSFDADSSINQSTCIGY